MLLPTVDVHLLRLLDRVTHIIADEVLNCASLARTYPQVGNLHPALRREGHVQSLLFDGLRASGYFTLAEANYFVPLSASRQIDLAVWLPDVLVWFYLEVKPCSPYYGVQPVVWDAQKLIDDKPTDLRDRLRGVLAYGFRDRVKERDGFPQKYKGIITELAPLGFREVGIQCRSLEGTEYTYVQTGLWVTES